MDMKEKIQSCLEDPHGLEILFRQEPDAFRRAFPEAHAQAPESIVLAVWQERLNDQDAQPEAKSTWLTGNLRLALLLAICAGICTRVLLYFAIEQDIAPVNVLFGVVPFLAAYFVMTQKPHKKVLVTLTGLLGTALIYFNLLPVEQSDSIVMAYLHLPVFLWVVLGLAYTGNGHRQTEARLAYIRFNGEFAIVYATFAISGMILTALTLMLFEIALPGQDVAKFYLENVVVFGAAALSLIAAYLVATQLKLARSMAPWIARIFSPLVFLTLLAYLVALVLAGRNPFLDRDFLIAFNGILLVVLAITIFSLTERADGEKRRPGDFLNVALISLALIIDIVALASIVF
ncbi:MAG: DUF4153 domain-containing protein, partial [Clostridia bacterium]|nr:DUF4153 domain-containing protein [Clostridia bacterium]